MPVQESAALTETTPASGAPSGTTPAGAGQNDQFLGIEPELQPLPASSEPTPEPAEEVETEQPEGEVTEEPEQGAETQETQPEESDDDWLPSEQEKRFPVETLEQYANKRGYNWDKIKDDPSLMRMLSDKLNTDIYAKQINEQAEQGAELEEQLPESEEIVQPGTTPDDPRSAHYQQVEKIAATIDPQATETLGRNLLGAMGVNADPKYVQQLQASLRNPQTTPQQRAEIQQHLDLVQNAGNIGGTLARGALDLVLTTLPTVLPQLIEQLYPGTQDNFERQVYRSSSVQAWDGIRSMTSNTGQPIYKDLPEFGTPAFKTLVSKAETDLGMKKGELADLVFRGTNAGNPKSIVDGARRAYLMVAKVARGQQVSPQVMANAVTTGRQKERDQNQRRAAGRALGAGSVSRQFTPEPEKDDVLDGLRQAISSQNEDEYPVSNLLPRRR